MQTTRPGLGMVVDSDTESRDHAIKEQRQLGEAQISLVYELTKKLNACSHIGAVLDEALKGLAAALGVQRMAILAFDGLRGSSSRVAAIGLSAQELASLTREITIDSLQRETIDASGDIINVGSDVLPEKLGRVLDTCRLLAIPLSTATGFRGLILADGFDGANQQHGHSAELVATMAGCVAAAIDRCDLLEERQRDSISLSTLRSMVCDVTQAVTSTLNLQDVLDRVAEASASIITADAAAVRLLDRNSEELVVGATHGLSKEFGRRERIGLGSRPTGWVAETRQPLALFDLANDDDATVRDLAIRDGITSYLGIPLVLGGQRVGVIEVYALGSLRRFTDEEIERLAALGHQAAIAIENARLFQAERDTVTKLRQLERHKTDFMAMLAHELRTPLTSIKGFAQLVLRQNACSRPEIVERYSSIIEAESNRMIGIINDILDITKMEAGVLEMSKQLLSISDSIYQAVTAASPLSRNHVLELNVPESLPLIRGDAAKIEQVLVNLISNAMKYSPEGEPIEIGAAADDEGVTVWVNDSGRGIPAEKFDHIFDKYKSIENGDGNGDSRSSGLGLYISKNFVEAHGGHMWVESEEGKGAKFLFKLYY